MELNFNLVGIPLTLEFQHQRPRMLGKAEQRFHQEDAQNFLCGFLVPFCLPERADHGLRRGRAEKARLLADRRSTPASRRKYSLCRQLTQRPANGDLRDGKPLHQSFFRVKQIAVVEVQIHQSAQLIHKRGIQRPAAADFQGKGA